MEPSGGEFDASAGSSSSNEQSQIDTEMIEILAMPGGPGRRRGRKREIEDQKPETVRY
jgi:hypothetical protein